MKSKRFYLLSFIRITVLSGVSENKRILILRFNFPRGYQGTHFEKISWRCILNSFISPYLNSFQSLQRHFTSCMTVTLSTPLLSFPQIKETIFCFLFTLNPHLALEASSGNSMEALFHYTGKLKSYTRRKFKSF